MTARLRAASSAPAARRARSPLRSRRACTRGRVRRAGRADDPRVPSAANAATSTRDAGGSSSTCSTRSGGGATSTGGPGSRPRARSWNTRPSHAEAREHRVGGQRGDVAEACATPGGRAGDAISSFSNTATGHGARNAADAPGSITRGSPLRARRAARPAVNSPSATPMRTSASPSSASTMTAWSRSASRRSPPK